MLILIYLIFSIYMPDAGLILIVDVYLFYWAINVLIPIVQKSGNAWIFWYLILSLPHEFIHYMQIIWYVIYYLNGGNSPFLYLNITDSTLLFVFALPHSQHFGRPAMGGISVSSLFAPRTRAIPNESFDFHSHLSEKN